MPDENGKPDPPPEQLKSKLWSLILAWNDSHATAYDLADLIQEIVMNEQFGANFLDCPDEFIMGTLFCCDANGDLAQDPKAAILKKRWV